MKNAAIHGSIPTGYGTISVKGAPLPQQRGESEPSTQSSLPLSDEPSMSSLMLTRSICSTTRGHSIVPGIYQHPMRSEDEEQSESDIHRIVAPDPASIVDQVPIQEGTPESRAICVLRGGIGTIPILIGAGLLTKGLLASKQDLFDVLFTALTGAFVLTVSVTSCLANKLTELPRKEGNKALIRHIAVSFTALAVPLLVVFVIYLFT